MNLNESISVLFLFLLLVFIFIIAIGIRYRKRINENIQMKLQFQQELLRAQLEIQEQTLKNISQEIHDNIGQMLSLAKLNLALADAEAQPPVQQKVSDSHQLVSKAIQDLRDLSRSLNTDYVSEMGLQRSIEYELEMIGKTGALKTAMLVEGQARRLDKQNELIVFRIVQESFNNILKHADASQLEVTLKYRPTEFFLSIGDNGKGVDLTPLNTDGNSGFGLGIRNMHNRARLIGADFSMNSTLGGGTMVVIRIPNE